MESLVAQRIKSVLEAKQISISAFSKMIGMQQVTCNRQLRGDQAVSLGLIEGFLNEFDEISAEWLFRGHGKQLIQKHYECLFELCNQLITNTIRNGLFLVGNKIVT